MPKGWALTVFFTLASLGALSATASAAPVYKIGDIATRSQYRNEFVVFKGYVYFSGGGGALWRTDGSEAGSTLVKDTQAGTTGYDPIQLTVVRDGSGNETLFFAASGGELWKSDGTTAGTVLVKDFGYPISRLTPALGQLVFSTSDPDQLGKSDGTEEGTVTWETIYQPYGMVEVGGAVYFTTNGWMWRSDLVSAPTRASNLLARDMFAMNGTLYFTGANGTEFYVCNGTPEGTVKILDMPELWAATGIKVVGSRAFFGTVHMIAPTTTEGLWTFDGGSVRQVAVVPVWEPVGGVGDRLYFRADDGASGEELWASDGTTAWRVKDINPGAAGSDPSLVIDSCVTTVNHHDDGCRVAESAGGSVYFFADDGTHGKELWRTDGTEAGTQLVQDIVPGATGSFDPYTGARAYGEDYMVFGAFFNQPKLHGLPLGKPFFAIEDGSAAEGTGGPSNAVVTVRLVPPSPGATSVQWATLDGTALAGVDYTASSGTVSFPAGSGSQTLSVPLIADAVPEVARKTFQVQLTGSSGAPIMHGRATITILNDDGPTLSIDDVTVQENAGTATFTVTRSAATADSVTVAYATANGTATAGKDYTAESGTVTFSAGQLTRPVTIAITNDASREPNEVFYVRLTNANYAVIGDDEGQGTIVSEDTAPTLTVADVSVTEGNSGTSNMTFTATLSAASDYYSVSVDFATADATATAPADYQAQSGTLNLPAGVSSATVVVPIAGDLIDESNETLAVNLTNPVNAVLARAQATGTIIDNDASRISVANTSVLEGDTGANAAATFTLTLSNPNAATVTVDYSTAPGTTNPAEAGVDYTTASGTLTFPPGTTSVPLSVTVIGDDVDEGANETFFLNLANATNATIQTARGTATITEDDDARFFVSDVSVVEGNSGQTAATVTVTLGAVYEADASVKYYTSNGSASATGSTPDFVGISNGASAGALLLSFPSGTTSQQVTVQVIGDTTREVGNEYFNFNLTGATGVTIADTQARVTILDDDIGAADRRLTISPKTASVTEPESGETPLSFTVSLLGASGTTPTPSGLPVTVQLARTGTATAGSDYTGVPASLSFPPGTTTQTVTAAVQSDGQLENQESAILTLSSPTNATIAATTTTTSGSATLTIYDAVSRTPLAFYTVEPCRAVDTRDAAKGGPDPVSAGAPRTFTLGGVCGIPATARSVSVNVTVVGATANGNARLYAGGTVMPGASTLNYVAGKTIANNAVVLLGDLADVTVAVAPAGAAHVIVDVNGYME
jgi:ELWxxDGT repeat protein